MCATISEQFIPLNRMNSRSLEVQMSR